jgi:hypothetical protein
VVRISRAIRETDLYACRRLRVINTENAWLHSLDRVIARLYAHGGGASEAETELDPDDLWGKRAGRCRRRLRSGDKTTELVLEPVKSRLFARDVGTYSDPPSESAASCEA